MADVNGQQCLPLRVVRVKVQMHAAKSSEADMMCLRVTGSAEDRSKGGVPAGGHIHACRSECRGPASDQSPIGSIPLQEPASTNHARPWHKAITAVSLQATYLQPSANSIGPSSEATLMPMAQGSMAAFLRPTCHKPQAVCQHTSP